MVTVHDATGAKPGKKFDFMKAGTLEIRENAIEAVAREDATGNRRGPEDAWHHDELWRSAQLRGVMKEFMSHRTERLVQSLFILALTFVAVPLRIFAIFAPWHWLLEDAGFPAASFAGAFGVWLIASLLVPNSIGPVRDGLSRLAMPASTFNDRCLREITASMGISAAALLCLAGWMLSEHFL